jgi:hypothetical protein
MLLTQEFLDPRRRRAKHVASGTVTHLHRVFGACGKFFSRVVGSISDIRSAGDIWRTVGRVASGWTLAVDRIVVESVRVTQGM